MLRYALLRHECPPEYRDGPHWDLLLERPDTDAEHRLATWSLLRLPSAWSQTRGVVDATCHETADGVSAEALPDHRAVYLDYEASVSGDRGAVTRLASGPIEWLEATADTVRVRLSGPAALAGDVELIRSAENVWQLHVTG